MLIIIIIVVIIYCFLCIWFKKGFTAHFLLLLVLIFFRVLQKNVDEALNLLKESGISAVGVTCHVSNAEQRKNLFKTTIDVRTCDFLLLSSSSRALKMQENVYIECLYP